MYEPGMIDTFDIDFGVIVTVTPLDIVSTKLSYWFAS
jgi:hypothetical protein